VDFEYVVGLPSACAEDGGTGTAVTSGCVARLEDVQKEGVESEK
jgi:hypothetical protein